MNPDAAMVGEDGPRFTVSREHYNGLTEQVVCLREDRDLWKQRALEYAAQLARDAIASPSPAPDPEIVEALRGLFLLACVSQDIDAGCPQMRAAGKLLATDEARRLTEQKG